MNFSLFAEVGAKLPEGEKFVAEFLQAPSEGKPAPKALAPQTVAPAACAVELPSAPTRRRAEILPRLKAVLILFFMILSLI